MTKDFRNKIFSASLFFRGVHNNMPSERDIWEENIVIVFANDENSALEKANDIGKSHEISYETSNNESVSWVFFCVERVFEIIEMEIDDGSEIFSRHLKTDEVKSMLKLFDGRF